MTLLDGKTAAKTILRHLQSDVQSLSRQPLLAVLLVGDDEASHVYVHLKQKRAEEIGIRTDVRRLTADTSEHDLLKIIQAWNEDPTVDGILVQLPLPYPLNEDAITHAIHPAKDVDGFHPLNIEKLYRSDPQAFIPPVHAAVLELIRSTEMKLDKQTAIIIGNSHIFMEPLKFILSQNHIQTTSVLYDNELRTSPFQLARFDIIITACGIPQWLNSSLVNEHTIIIDIGTTRLPNGSIVGDVDQLSFNQKTGWLTPVPGGVGPMTIAMLLYNVVKAARD